MRKLELTPKVLEKDGKKMFVVLPYEQFTELAEAWRNWKTCAT